MLNPTTKTIKMTERDHLKWDAALRSGEFDQGEGWLEDENGAMCCLGVLESALERKVESLSVPSEYFLSRNKIQFTNEYADEVGAPSVFVPSLNSWRSVAWLNDVHKLSFVGIADLIKNHVEYIPETKGQNYGNV